MVGLEVQESRSSMNFGWKFLDDYYEEWGMGIGGGGGERGKGKEKGKEKGKGERGRDGIHLDLDK